MDWASAAVLGTPMVGVVAYVVQLKGRVDAHDTLLEKEESFSRERQDLTNQRLARMETKLDQVLELTRRV